MFVSFGTSLRRMGKVRFGAGYRMKGSTAWIMLIVYGLLYMCWYLMLGTLWMLYGICYLFFYLPIKGIVKLCRKEQQKKKIAEASQKYNRDGSNS